MHTIIIAYACGYFRTLLSNDVIETRNNQVNFTFDKKAFSELINYIYSGDIKLSIENISELLEIADYLQVHLLLYYTIIIQIYTTIELYVNI